MKATTMWLLGLLLLLAGCRAHYPVAQQSGKEDMAYLLFVSGKQYTGERVEVSIDGQTNFTAKVVKATKANRKGTQYGVATGVKDIRVSHQGKLIYSKKILLSTQEIQIITLP